MIEHQEGANGKLVFKVTYLDDPYREKVEYFDTLNQVQVNIENYLKDKYKVGDIKGNIKTRTPRSKPKEAVPTEGAVSAKGAKPPTTPEVSKSPQEIANELLNKITLFQELRNKSGDKDVKDTLKSHIKSANNFLKEYFGNKDTNNLTIDGMGEEFTKFLLEKIKDNPDKQLDLVSLLLEYKQKINEEFEAKHPKREEGEVRQVTIDLSTEDGFNYAIRRAKSNELTNADIEQLKEKLLTQLYGENIPKNKRHSSLETLIKQYERTKNLKNKTNIKTIDDAIEAVDTIKANRSQNIIGYDKVAQQIYDAIEKVTEGKLKFAGIDKVQGTTWSKLKKSS